MLRIKRTKLSNQIEVEHIRNGDAQAYEKLFHTYFEPLSLYTNTFLKDIDLAQDIVQQMFVTLYEKREQLQIHTSIKSYLYTAVRNRAMDHLRSQKIHSLHHEKIKASQSEIDTTEDEEVLRTELQQKLYHAIAQLPEQNLKIFRMSRMQGLSNQEIAEELGLTKRTVETHISNALKKLRTLVHLVSIILIIRFL